MTSDYGIRWRTERAKEWLEEHLVFEDWQWLGNILAIEPRMIPAIVEAMLEDGLTPKDFAPA